MTAGARALDAYRDRSVLVTGATGFVGRAVARRLAGVAGRLTLATRVPVDPEEIVGQGSGRTRVVTWDATDPRSIDGLVAASAPAIVFNLAGYGVSPDERDPVSARAINAELPGRLAAAVSAVDRDGWDGARIVHAGSALEYGEATGELDESTVPLPTTLYGETKLAGTAGVAEALTEAGETGLTARLFTVYGPGERTGRLLPSLIRCAATGAPLELSEGLQRRDFTYVGDVAEGLVRLGLTRPPADPVRIVNLATGRLMTVRAFATTAVRVLGIDPGLLVWGALPTRPEEMRHDPVAVGLLERLTGWLPRTPVADGIAATAGEARRP
ncbi:MAG: NAD(P)-dependent oxidoreductase [Gemmatimonadota bacterium]|nr:NAD(P)-dependent oxidoreductase [Gemmatimonadota bacterium]